MTDTLSTYAQSQPDKPCVIDDRPDGTVVTWTYAELEAQSNRVANLLLRLGAGPGTKVLWCGPNSPEVIAVMNATRKIGAIAVPLNYRLTAEEARYVIDHSDAEVAYVDHEYAPMFAMLRGRLEKMRHIIAVGGPAPGGMLGDADIAAAPAGAPGAGDAAGAGGTMIYTSGTTGKPKGALRTGAPDPGFLAPCWACSATGATMFTSPPARCTTAGPARSWVPPCSTARRSSCSASSTPRTGCGWWTG